MIRFAYSAYVHIDRSTDHNVVEMLEDSACNDSMLYPDDDVDYLYELQQLHNAQIDKLPDGIHVVFITGTIQYVTTPTDCGDEHDRHVYIDTEHWRQASDQEIAELNDQVAKDAIHFKEGT